MKMDREVLVLRIRHEVGPGALVAEEADRPEPGAGEVLIRTRAVGVTLPAVRKVRDARDPISLAGEVAGQIVALGEGSPPSASETVSLGCASPTPTPSSRS